jgi:hypothetical protein
MKDCTLFFAGVMSFPRTLNVLLKGFSGFGGSYDGYEPSLVEKHSFLL